VQVLYLRLLFSSRSFLSSFPYCLSPFAHMQLIFPLLKDKDNFLHLRSLPKLLL
jgi:hypothetical protein